MLKIRLARRGRKKLALFDVVVADSRSPRDGRFIEKIGTYNPNTNPASIELNNDGALKWLLNGAQPTPTVRAMLSYRGVLYKKHLQVGVIKGAITQEQADERYLKWEETKFAKISKKVDTLATQKAQEAKARLEAETKIKEARAEALKKKMEAEKAVQNAELEAKEEKEKAAVEAIKSETTEEITSESTAQEEVADQTPAQETTGDENTGN